MAEGLRGRAGGRAVRRGASGRGGERSGTGAALLESGAWASGQARGGPSGGRGGPHPFLGRAGAGAHSLLGRAGSAERKHPGRPAALEQSGSLRVHGRPQNHPLGPLSARPPSRPRAPLPASGPGGRMSVVATRSNEFGRRGCGRRAGQARARGPFSASQTSGRSARRRSFGLSRNHRATRRISAASWGESAAGPASTSP